MFIVNWLGLFKGGLVGGAGRAKAPPLYLELN